jgi:uncharacterized membrane protein YoaK (UPF0700 family)
MRSVSIRFVLWSTSILTALAGYINTIFLTLYLFPVSHLSGTLSRVSLDISKLDLSDLGQVSSILVCFGIGAVISGAVIGNNMVQLGRRYGVVLGLEGIFLGLSAWFLPTYPIVAVSLASLACGIQNGMASSYRGMIIRTTHITGVVTDLGVLIGYWLRHRKIDGWRFAILALTIFSFGIGGLLGAVVSKQLGANALWFAAVIASSIGAVYYMWRHYLTIKAQKLSPAMRK